MNPTRRAEINGHVIEEFYWNGRMVVYVDNHIAIGDYVEEVSCALGGKS